MPSVLEPELDRPSLGVVHFQALREEPRAEVAKAFIRQANPKGSPPRSLIGYWPSFRPATLSPKLHQKLIELASLRPGWDGPDSQAIRAETVSAVTQALEHLTNMFPDFREPYVIPTFDGYLQLEWHDLDRSLEIERRDDGWGIFGVDAADKQQRRCYAVEVQARQLQSLDQVYGWFANRDLLWPLR